MSDLNYVVISTVHDNDNDYARKAHGHENFGWARAPTGYKLHATRYVKQGDKHIHLGIFVKQPEPLPTLFEAVEAFFDERGKPNTWMNPVAILVNVYEAYQREKGETDE